MQHAVGFTRLSGARPTIGTLYTPVCRPPGQMKENCKGFGLVETLNLCYNDGVSLKKGGRPVNWIFDGVVIGVCLLCVLVGVQRGFIRSVVHFLGSIIAACLASALGGALAQWLFDTLFRDAMVEKINASLQSLGAENAVAAAEQVLASLPDFLVRALEEAGVTASAIAGGVGSQTNQAARMVTDYLSPVFVNFLKVLAVIVLFFLFMTLVRMLASLVGSLLKLPVLGQLDGLLGGIFGFLLAMVSVWIVVAGIMVFLPMLDEATQADVQTALDQSFLAGLFVKVNPLKGLFG